MKIDYQHFAAAYRVARSVFDEGTSVGDGVQALEAKGLNPVSASIFIYNFRNMLGGEVYKRAMSIPATEHFLKQILHDYGPGKLENALTALRLHIRYKGGSMNGYERLAEKHSAILAKLNSGSEPRPRLQILPMSQEESDDESIGSVQEEYFLHRLPLILSGSYRCYTTITAPPGSTVLFQFRAAIIASAQLISVGRLEKPDNNGYTHEMIFDPASIRIFDPIDKVPICAIWPKVKQLDQTRWILDPNRLSAFELFVRNVRTPELRDSDATSDSTLPGYSPTGTDTRTPTSIQIRLRRGQSSFRRSLLKRYGGKCLVTGSSLTALLEAAHISPYRSDDDNHVENGLILRADIHTLFDLNLLGIEPNELRVKLHPKAAKEYAEYRDVRLRCQNNSRPSQAALELRYKEFQAAL